MAAKSPNSCLIWAKHEKAEGERPEAWLPLWMHLEDSLHVSRLLWDNWVPSSVKRAIFSDLKVSAAEAGIFLAWLAGHHDIGKVSPDFSGRSHVAMDTQTLYSNLCEAGFSYEENLFMRRGHEMRHESMGAAIMGDTFSDEELTVLAIIAGHHGSPVTDGDFSEIAERTDCLTSEWKLSIQDHRDHVMSLLPSYTFDLVGSISKLGIPKRTQVLLTSLVIMSDWLASNSDNFPLLPIATVPAIGEPSIDMQARANSGFAKVTLPAQVEITELVSPDWNEVFRKRFNLSPEYSLFPAQRELIDAALEADGPEIFIMEAPMGDGKTEAALLAAEVLLRKGAHGIFVGLPTMATTEAMYSRVKPFLASLLEEEGIKGSYSLGHSKAEFSEEYQADKKVTYSSRRSQFSQQGWFQGGKQKALNTFTVGTIDNFLMLSLKAKYAYWRHLGMASKVVVIDEVHAADEYMVEYLKRSLQWAGFYGCSVILLSATLPAAVRKDLLEAYSIGKKAGKEIG